MGQATPETILRPHSSRLTCAWEVKPISEPPSCVARFRVKLVDDLIRLRWDASPLRVEFGTRNVQNVQMNDGEKRYTGGCLCGALRYEAFGEPLYAGHCYCSDCQKASGSGFIPFMGFPRSAVRFSGKTRRFRTKAARGGEAVRNFCSICGSLVFGGELGKADSFTIYAGSLDDPSSFHPKLAIFARSRPHWAIIPGDLAVFEEMPPQDPPRRV